MRTIALLLFALMLPACGTISVKQSLPDLPPELAKPCTPLQTIPGETTTVAVLMTTVSKNYMYSHECAAQMDTIQGWYIDQKKIFDEANN